MSSSSSNLQSFWVVYLLFSFHYGSINTQYKSIIYVLRKVEFAICSSKAYTLCAAQNRFFTKQKKFTKFYFGSKEVQKPLATNAPKFLTCFVFGIFRLSWCSCRPNCYRRVKSWSKRQSVQNGLLN